MCVCETALAVKTSARTSSRKIAEKNASETRAVSQPRIARVFSVFSFFILRYENAKRNVPSAALHEGQGRGGREKKLATWKS